MAVTAIHLVIHGRVQGVGFRDWFGQIAKQYSLTGWVRNATNGRIEAVLIGDNLEVSQAVSDCKTGPAGSNVLRVESSPWAGESFNSFETLPTAA